MSDSLLYAVFTFLILLVIINVCGDLIIASLVISVIASFVTIIAYLGGCRSAADRPPTNTQAPVGAPTPVVDPPAHYIGNAPPDAEPFDDPEYADLAADQPDFASFVARQTPADDFSTYNADNAAIVYTMNRGNRVLRADEAAVLKSADYYRPNFAGELDEEERKVWWGRDEV